MHGKGKCEVMEHTGVATGGGVVAEMLDRFQNGLVP